MKNWLILILCGLTILACGLKTKIKQDLTQKVEAGQMAPDFRYSGIDGTSGNLSSLKGKVVLISFFATSCGICLDELPLLQTEIFESFHTNPDFVLLAVGLNDSVQLADFNAKKQFGFQPIADPDEQIFSRYASDVIPRNFVVDREGKIAYTSAGFREEAFIQLKTQIENLLK